MCGGVFWMHGVKPISSLDIRAERNTKRKSFKVLSLLPFDPSQVICLTSKLDIGYRLVGRAGGGGEL